MDSKCTVNEPYVTFFLLSNENVGASNSHKIIGKHLESLKYDEVIQKSSDHVGIAAIFVIG